MQDQFEAIVIGAGQGGIPLARAMAGKGWKTALVESRMVGGVCTNDGCTPTKTMVASARVAALAQRGPEYGIRTGAVTTDMARVTARAEELASKGRHKIEETLLATENLELIYGEGCFAPQQPGGEQHAVEIQLRTGGTRTLTASRVFLDVGERPAPAKVEGLDQVPYLDSSSILKLEELPEHLLILGGGYIAIEFAQMFRRFGAAVTILERGEQLLDREDDDIAACMASILREDGITLHCNAEARRVSGRAGAVEVTAALGSGEQSFRGSHLLVATGRVPNSNALQLDRAGVTQDKKGYVQVNERLETCVPGIWALGDVTGGPPYTHASYDDFRILRANLLEGGTCSTKDRVVPYCIFTDPELGRVGLSEKEARSQGLDVQIATAPMRKTARAAESGETRGMMKAVVARETGKLLGAAILGVSGGEVVTQLQLAMMGGLTAEQLHQAIFIHPVLAEGLHVLFANLHDAAPQQRTA